MPVRDLTPPLCVRPDIHQAVRTTQKRAKEVYTKHYDCENMAYYWYNTQIETYLWGKPLGLGGWDVDPEDRVGAEVLACTLHRRLHRGMCARCACLSDFLAEIIFVVLALSREQDCNQPWFRAQFRFLSTCTYVFNLISYPSRRCVCVFLFSAGGYQLCFRPTYLESLIPQTYVGEEATVPRVPLRLPRVQVIRP